MTQKTKPKTFRCGNVHASVWRNEVKKDGRTLVRHSIRLQKRIRRSDGSYDYVSGQFYPEELPRLVAVAQRAYEHITLIESKDAEQPE
jgi:hypothetical protein